jgi:hypothetical protein
MQLIRMKPNTIPIQYKLLEIDDSKTWKLNGPSALAYELLIYVLL